MRDDDASERYCVTCFKGTTNFGIDFPPSTTTIKVSMDMIGVLLFLYIIVDAPRPGGHNRFILTLYLKVHSMDPVYTASLKAET